MKVKEINAVAHTCWSPENATSNFLACGTSANHFDSSKDSSLLQVFDIAHGNTLEAKLISSCSIPYRFQKILWNNASNFSVNGLIVGGCDNGSINLYCAEKLFAGENECVNETKRKHDGPVFSLDFNYHQSNLLASGSKESVIYIWDLNNTNRPMIPGSTPTVKDNVTDLAWNRQLEHILASTYAGRCVVYDLRKNTSIMQINEAVSRTGLKKLVTIFVESKRKYSNKLNLKKIAYISMKVDRVNWHPSVATQLILTSSDDKTPHGHVWDLRFATAPLKTLEGHQMGIADSSWSTHDSDLFITSGKDNKIFVWNVDQHESSCEITGEFPSYNQWSFEVNWCQRDAALVATSSVDGFVSVYSVIGAGVPPEQNNKFSAIADSFPGMEVMSEIPKMAQPASINLKNPPKWFPKKCGANFAFGGRLISWNVNDNKVSISQVVTDKEFVDRSLNLEKIFSEGDVASFCQNKSQAAVDDSKKMIWEFLEATLQPSFRTNYMAILGYESNQVSNVVKPQEKLLGQVIDQLAALDTEDSTIDPNEQFEMIASAHENDPNDVPIPKASPTRIELSTGSSADGMIRKAILLSDFASAAQLCLEQKKYSLALIIAAHVGGELYEKTREKVFENESDDVSSLVEYVVNSDLNSIVSKCELRDCKEAFLAILTYADEQQFANLMEYLGDRLGSSADSTHLKMSIYCYLCAGNLDKFLVALKKCFPENDVKRKTENFMDLVEIILTLEKVLTLSGRAPFISEESLTSDFLCKYASLLASQGAASTALSYLSNATEGEMKELRDRLHRFTGYHSTAATSSFRKGSSSSQHSIGHTAAPLAQPQKFTQPYTAAPLGQPQKFTQPMAAVPPYGSGQPGYLAPSVAPGYNTSQYGAPPSAMYGGGTYPSYQTQAPPQNVSGAPPPSDVKGSGGFRRPNVGNRYVQNTVSNYSGPQQSQFPGQLGPPMPAPGIPAGNALPFGPQVPSMPTGNVMPTGPQIPNMQAGMFAPQPHPAHFPPPQNDMRRPSSSSSHADEHLPAAYDPAIPRGWNDPPVISESRKAKMRQKSHLSSDRRSPMPTPMVPEQTLPPQMMGQNFPPPLPNFGAPSGQNFGSGSQFQPPPLAQNMPTSRHTPTPPQQITQPQLSRKPLPAQHASIQHVFDNLRSKGIQISQNPVSRQRLASLEPKFSVLYEKITEGHVGETTLQGLHAIVEAVQVGDYYRALHSHTATINSGNFSEMSQFMPAIKVLITTCMQAQIFL